MEREQYSKAVNKLLALAQRDSGGSKVAAQLLLSAYNGAEFQLDVAGMRNLDWGNFETAMIVIRGSFECGCEPQDVVDNGSAVFGRLRDQWKHLHVKERGKPHCPTCWGHGKVYRDDDDEIGRSCERCNGTGRVCQCQGQTGLAFHLQK